MNLKIKREEIETMQTYYQVSRLQEHREAIEARKRVVRRFKAIVNLFLAGLALLVILEAFIP